MHSVVATRAKNVAEGAAESSLPATPYLTIDLDLLESNIRWLAAFARERGVGLRPHAKTHKCTAIARRQLAAGANGICCSTIDEAEVMVGAGLPGVLVTSPLVGLEKVRRFAELVERAGDVRTVVDDAASAVALGEVLAQRSLTAGVLIDVDVGQNRTGVSPRGVGSMAATLASMPALRLNGLQAYAGHVQHMADAQQRRTAALAIHDVVRDLRRSLSGLLPDIAIVSGGGTGTHSLDADPTAFTEIQAGSYVFMDVEYEDIDPPGTIEWPFRTSLGIQTMVVSAPCPGTVTTDAGTKAIAVNGPPPRIVTAGYTGFTYGFSGDEHGRITVPAGLENPQVGTRLTCTVSHCDPTVALHDRLYGMRSGEIVEVLDVDARGRR